MRAFFLLLGFFPEQFPGGKDHPSLFLIYFCDTHLDLFAQVFVEIHHMAQSQAGSGDEAADAALVGDYAFVYYSVHRDGQSSLFIPVLFHFFPDFLILVLECVKGLIYCF